MSEEGTDRTRNYAGITGYSTALTKSPESGLLTKNSANQERESDDHKTQESLSSRSDTSRSYKRLRVAGEIINSDDSTESVHDHKMGMSDGSEGENVIDSDVLASTTQRNIKYRPELSEPRPEGNTFEEYGMKGSADQANLLDNGSDYADHSSLSSTSSGQGRDLFRTREKFPECDLEETSAGFQVTRERRAQIPQCSRSNKFNHSSQLVSDADGSEVEIDDPPSRNLATGHFSMLASISARSKRPISSIAQFPKRNKKGSSRMVNHNTTGFQAMSRNPGIEDITPTGKRLQSPLNKSHESDQAPSPIYTATSENTRAKRTQAPNMKQPRQKRRLAYRSEDFDSEAAVATLPAGRHKKIKVISRNEKPTIPRHAKTKTGSRSHRRPLKRPQKSQSVRTQPKLKRGQKKDVKHYPDAGPTHRDMFRWVKSQAKDLNAAPADIVISSGEPDQQEAAAMSRGIQHDGEQSSGAWEKFCKEKKEQEDELNKLHKDCAVTISEDILALCKDDLIFLDFEPWEVSCGVRYVLH